MQKEDKGIATTNKDIEKVLPKSRLNNAIQLMVNLILCGVFLIILLGAPKNLFNYLLLFWGLIALYVLISGLNKLSETLVISLKGFKYSTFFENLDFEWRDVVKIEVVTHIQRSEQTGLVISSDTEYIIHTSKKDLTLKEDKDWGKDTITLKEVYEKIISRAPHAEVIQREVETTINENAGK